MLGKVWVTSPQCTVNPPNTAALGTGENGGIGGGGGGTTTVYCCSKGMGKYFNTDNLSHIWLDYTDKVPSTNSVSF